MTIATDAKIQKFVAWVMVPVLLIMLYIVWKRNYGINKKT